MDAIAFAGTFNPMTNGHVWVINEGLKLASTVIVLIADNSSKQSISSEQRKSAIEQVVLEQQWGDKVRVEIIKGQYVAQYAQQQGIPFLIRGLRNAADFDYENIIQDTNSRVLNGVGTVFVMTPRHLNAVSSSYVRSLVGPLGWHWAIQQFIPASVYKSIKMQWLKTEWTDVFKNDTTLARFDEIMALYSGDDRFYHNTEHLVHGLCEINTLMLSSHDTAILKRAFFYHDAVYKHASTMSDEEASAILAHDHGLGIDECTLIRCTDHFQQTTISHPLMDYMLSVDLAILGQDSSIYQAYTKAIKCEYSHVPDEAYLQGRKKALTHLKHKAKQNILYPNLLLAQRYNLTALHNLQAELDVLNSL